MQSIKRLPRSVHRPLRTGIVLFDLPTIVEELIYNSVDAGATKVSVSLSVRACYIKVEDDGCGITRDDLVIVGEKHATSKFGLVDHMEMSAGTIGFRGEALGSLSDISLVEVRTKARGRPHAYCKLIKGSKCLFLGIDDQREAVGTTVIVRDIFHNQPVRRKYMQSSPKRVLHSVKKCVFRTALIHPQISFRVADIENEDELLCTVPSSSPLPLVADGFGSEVSNYLHRIVFSDQNLMLSGYISGPVDTFSTKAFQYIYINSRFVSKGRIHNLLNSLTSSFQYSLAQLKDEPQSDSGKRRNTQGYPAYLLNVCCPLSSYDLYFEPSKTVIEFKEWDSVLSFFEQAMRHFWKQLPIQSLQGNPFDQENGVPMKRKVQEEDMFTMDISKTCNKRKKESNILLQKISLSRGSIASPMEILSEDTNVSQNHGISVEDPHGFLEFKPYRSNTDYFDQADCYSLVANDKLEILSSTHDQLSCIDSIPYQLTSDVMGNHAFTDLTPKVREKYDTSGSKLKKKPPDSAKSLKDKVAHRGATDASDVIIGTQEVKYPSALPLTFPGTGIESCSFMENEHCNLSYYSTQNGLDVQLDHLTEGNFPPDDIDAMDADYCSERLNLRDAFSREKIDAFKSYFGVLGKCQTNKESVFSKADMIGPYPSRQDSLTKENSLNDWLEDWENVSRCRFTETEWCLNSPHYPSARSCQIDCDPRGTNASEWNLGSLKNIDSLCLGIKEEKDEYFDSVRKSCTEVLPSTSCTATEVDYGNACSLRSSSHCSYLTDEITYEKKCLPARSNDGTHWLLSDLSKVEPSDCCFKSTFHPVQNHDNVIESLCDELTLKYHQPFQAHKMRSGRSHSAPPFYKGKLKLSISNASLTTTVEKEHDPRSKASPEDVSLLSGLSQPFTSEPFRISVHSEVSEQALSIDENCSAQEIKECCPVASITEELEHATSEMRKWQTSTLQPADGDFTHNSLEHNDDILDISSGLLHLSGSSLVPESIDKDCLENASVLLQLDRKFIPVMASGTLIIIDQHAADERIRLEELRQKVLSGEGCGIAYLDYEKELVLPEMGFQLLLKYSEQILKWGWICSTHCQSSESLRKNINLLKKRTCAATLVAVPCILGINLTEKDLLEFIEQLVETDGSSTLPPAVLRILNSKACRGAIMFGDSLLPSECSLIVEELKATSLCFQCAHGRPTTVPLLNMASLHEQLARLEVRDGGASETWHGLFHHKPSIERAQMRLDFAKGFHNG